MNGLISFSFPEFIHFVFSINEYLCKPFFCMEEFYDMTGIPYQSPDFGSATIG